MQKFLVAAQATLLVCALMTAAVVLALLAGQASDLPAWVQAVGSIAALFIAIFVMARQNQNAASLLIRQNKHATKLVIDANRLTTLGRARSVHAIIKRSHLQIKALSNLSKMALDTRTFNPAALAVTFSNGADTIDSIKGRLAAIPVHDLGGYEMSEAILQFSEILDSYQRIILALSRVPQDCGSPLIIEGISHLDKIQLEALEHFEKGIMQLEKTFDPD
jgi:hypothetical protein